MHRTTIAKDAVLKGIGLHTGQPCVMIIKPYDKGGIYFSRTDIKGSAPVKAALENVSSTMRGTNLSDGTAEVHTIEHVLSSCAALGITDALVEMDGPEPPVTDGSAAVYCAEMEKAGIKELSSGIETFTVSEKIEMRNGDIYYSAEPAEKLTFSFLYRHAHPLVGEQKYTFEFSKDGYLKEIAPARTFGFEEELEFLKKHGLAKGGTTENAVVIKKDSYAAPLRFDNELVRHKILDMIGDFMLMNRSLGNIKFYSELGGHKSNVEFGKLLLKG